MFGRLVVLMGRMAGGDGAAVFTFYEEFGDRIARTMRTQLRRLGTEYVDREDLDGLVIDGCLTLADCAAGWDPAGGAMPWVWAERRLVQVASGFVGQYADGLDDDRSTAATAAAPVSPPGSAVDVDEVEVLESLAAELQEVALLAEALERVTTPRNRRILLGYQLQASLGDPAPSQTLGTEHEMQPAAIRQVVKRAKDKLRTLAATDDRFSPLLDLALLAA